MSEVRYVVNLIVHDDGHVEVIWDSSVSQQECFQAVKQVAQDMEAALGQTPPTPPKNSPPKITRLK